MGALSVWGSFLVSGSSDSTVRLWDLSQGMVEDPDGGGGGGGGGDGGGGRVGGGKGSNVGGPSHECVRVVDVNSEVVSLHVC